MPHAARSRTGYQASRFVATDRGVSLRIASFLLDLAGRAHSFQEFLAGGVPVNDALAVSGLMANHDARVMTQKNTFAKATVTVKPVFLCHNSMWYTPKR